MMRIFGNVGLVVALIAGSFLAGLAVGGKSHAEGIAGAGGDMPQGIDLAPVWKVWSILDDRFVATASSTRVDNQEKVYGMIEGLTKAYGDPYTVFMPPQDAAMFDEEISGEFSGVGMEIGMRDDLLTVIAPLKGTPADMAGILTGDILIEINGTSTGDMSVDEAVKNIRGPAGSKVILTIARKGEKELLTKTVTRQAIHIPTLDSELRSDGIFVIHLYNFGATAPAEMRAALKKFIQSGSTKLILDLRGNPGGYLEGAVDIASWFLPAGSTIVSEDFGSKEKQNIHRSKGYNIFKDNWKMVVLVNEGSASASEILAGALQEHKRAVLIGTKTFGKGSVQELIKVTPNTSLKVTIARWLTPNGVSISQNGLTPDIKVDRTAEEYLAGKDPQFDAAIQYILGKK
jgi:carboxyl-terminal processing protease